MIFVTGDSYMNIYAFDYDKDSTSLQLLIGPGHWNMDEFFCATALNRQ